MTALPETPDASEALLTNIITLTEQRDQHSLEYSLFQALEDILEPQSLLGLEWQEAGGDFLVVHESPRLPRPPHEVLRAARKREQAFEHLGRLEGQDWLCLGIDTMADSPRRQLILGLAEWRQAELRIARGMLRVYQNFMRLLNDSEKDILTGLMNRRRLERHLADLLAASRLGRRDHDRDRRDYLAVLDIDHFKAVNDTHGHLIGDEVLLLFANVLRQTLRDEDRCYRYGGEEFIVLLRDIGREYALTVMERLRRAVSNHAFPQVGHITVSIGLTQIEHQRLPTQVIEEADRALYYAKNHGRDQVREFRALLAAGEIQVSDVSGSVELF